jgi:surface protein
MFIIELGKCEPVNYISVYYSDNVNYEKFNTVSREGKVKYLNITYGDSTYKIIKPDENFTIPANTTVNIYLRYNVTNLDEFFSSSDKNAEYISSINGFVFESLEVNSSKFMFSGCTGLTTIKLNGFRTGKIRDMSGMFQGCSSLTNFDSSFDTSSLIKMNSMFSGCTNLKTVNLPQIDIERSLKANNDSEFFDMSNLFSECEQLKEIHFEKVVAKINKYQSSDMLLKCPSLENIYMNNIHYLNNIFAENDNITSLKYINLENCIQSYYSSQDNLFKNKEDLIICQKKAPNKGPLIYKALICCDYERDPDLCYPVETTIFTTTPLLETS